MPQRKREGEGEYIYFCFGNWVAVLEKKKKMR